MKNKTFYSNGKLLITGEYVVLDGAKSLAVPTKYGQSLSIEPINEHKLFWESYDEKNELWFHGAFEIKENTIESIDSSETTQRLIQILSAAKTLNPEFLSSNQGFKITTILDFPTNWGLGTSSTLINNIAQWAHVDAYLLLEKTFGGSGYDIACAQHNTPITYQIKNDSPVVDVVKFNPAFKNNLYFVHLNKKQNSREGIEHYKNHKKNISPAIEHINEITLKLMDCHTLDGFNHLVMKHEGIIANITNQKTVKHLLFEDFDGAIKSLGAWGGDFILATSKANPSDYFKSKGYDTVIPYVEMILE